MKALVRQGAKDFYVRQGAIDILLEKQVRPKHYLGEIKALFEWVQGSIRYTKDPFRLEVLHSARRMLELRAGDCDDMAILLGAMLESIGHPVRLVLVGPDPLRPRLFSHVYLEVYHKGRWIPLDPTMSYAMGWAPRGLVKEVIAMDSRANKVPGQVGLHEAFAAVGVPGWLRALIRAIRLEALDPKDERLRMLWNLLKQRQILGRSRWLQALLRLIWNRGLPARPRPRTTQRLVRLLRRWGLLPSPAARSVARRPILHRPVTLVSVQPVRPVVVRPVRPVTARPGTRPAARR